MTTACSSSCPSDTEALCHWELTLQVPASEISDSDTVEICVGPSCASLTGRDLQRSGTILYTGDGPPLPVASDYPFPIEGFVVQAGEVRAGVLGTTDVVVNANGDRTAHEVQIPAERCGDECGSVDLAYNRGTRSIEETARVAEEDPST